MEYFQKDIETMPRRAMRELQLERLKWIVHYCYDCSPVYRKKFDLAGLKPNHIKTLLDIKLIPFTTKQDFAENYPYGMFVSPMDQIVRVHASSGTTGIPTVVGYTKQDLDNWSDTVARFIVSMGGSSNDIVQISFGYGLFTGAFGLHQGWEKIGATIIPVSSGNTERQVKILKDFKATALVSTPSYALYISETMKKMGVSIEEISLRLGFFGAEASTKQIHDLLAKTFNIVTNDNYGLSEIAGPGVSGECIFKDGMHIAEDQFYPEVLDRETLEPLNEGKTGELVLTTLTKTGMPILRYRTKDLTSLNYNTCACGRTTVRMSKITGRTDDMLIVRGVNVFPSQVESVLFEIAGVGTNYEIVLSRDGYLDVMQINVEVSDGEMLIDFANLQKLRTSIQAKLKTVLQLDTVVKLVEPSSIKRGEGKVKRVTDLRPKY